MTIAQRAQALEPIARQIRHHIVDMVYTAQSGHCGGSLSSTDIMAALYFDLLHVDPKNPGWVDRDRFVLSKGHACPVWYASLALRGFFDVGELKTLRQMGSMLQGHPVATKTPGIDATAGSLGIGVCTALGMALEARLSKRNYRVWAILGDGELNEGAVWEMAAAAGKFKPGNFAIIIDRNHLQNDGTTEDIMPMEPIDQKFRAFGWHVLTMDGHNLVDILTTLEKAQTLTDKPVCIIAATVKGKGVSFMENQRDWHGKAPNQAEHAQAVNEIGAFPGKGA